MEEDLRKILYELKEIKKEIRAIKNNSNPDIKKITANVVKSINDKNKVEDTTMIEV